MAVIVKLKNKATGEVTEHFSVDAKEILPRGEHEQIEGRPVMFALLAQPEPEESPAPAAEPVTEPAPASEGEPQEKGVVSRILAAGKRGKKSKKG